MLDKFCIFLHLKLEDYEPKTVLQHIAWVQLNFNHNPVALTRRHVLFVNSLTKITINNDIVL